MLSTHPGRRGAERGIADAHLGEIVAAALALRPDATLTPDEVQDFARAQLAPYKVPAKIVFVASLPRNSSGKVIRAELPKLLD